MENKNTTRVPSIESEEYRDTVLERRKNSKVKTLAHKESKAIDYVSTLAEGVFVLTEYDSTLLAFILEICRANYARYDYTIRIMSGQEGKMLLEPAFKFVPLK